MRRWTYQEVEALKSDEQVEDLLMEDGEERGRSRLGLYRCLRHGRGLSVLEAMAEVLNAIIGAKEQQER